MSSTLYLPNRRLLLQGLTSSLLITASVGAKAQSGAGKPVKIVVPFPAGGGTDMLARALADGLAKELGRSVIVENKAGAGTVVGNDMVAKSTPDGSTLLLNTSAVAIVPSLYPKLPYAPNSDLTPVTVLGRTPNVLVVRSESPIVSASGFIAQARANPGKLTYGSAGNGTSTHLSAELLKVQARLFVVHVPYRGAAPMITDLIGGQIDVGFGTLPSVAPFLASGKLRALALTGQERSALLPNIQTFAEAGVTGYRADTWYGVFAPGGTPSAVIRSLYEAIRRVSETEAFRRRAASEGLTLTLNSPEDTGRIYLADQEKWRKVIAQQSIRAD